MRIRVPTYKRLHAVDREHYIYLFTPLAALILRIDIVLHILVCKKFVFNVYVYNLYWYILPGLKCFF